MRDLVASLLITAAVSGCSVVPSLPPGLSIECGPVADRALCIRAIELAATVKINAPAVAATSIRLPRPDDACADWLNPCAAQAVIVVIQSGDTLQDVPMAPSVDGWVLLDRP